MTHRLVVWGTGNVGRPALRAVAAHREPELVLLVITGASQLRSD